jgi:hypothetical protein
MVTLTAWVALVVLAGAVCVAVIFAIQKPMSELLKANSYISPAGKFYMRSFSLIILSATLGAVVGAGKLSEEQSESFMQGVWWVLDNLGPVLWTATWSLGGYALLLTVLFAVLGRHHDE